MQFGVFDHLDRGASSLRDYYEDRLRIIEIYDREGFYAYHVAEHHSTPLGMAPSPSVFLSAIAQRTRNLRFGPLVYAMPLYHPLRLIEEICMLDQLSGGRLEIGFGRGSSPIELKLYGQNPSEAQRKYTEGLKLVLKGLSEKTLNFQGEFFSIDNVPMELEPLQKPHPPLWYGVHSRESAERAARQGLHIVSLDRADETRVFSDQYRETWNQARGGSEAMPLIGIGRFIVVAEETEKAVDMARRAYPIWHRSFNHLFRLYGSAPTHQRPPDFDTLQSEGKGVAGNPDAVRTFLEEELSEAGATYLVGQFAFGDLSFEECRRSVDLFARHVMPGLRPLP